MDQKLEIHDRIHVAIIWLWTTTSSSAALIGIQYPFREGVHERAADPFEEALFSSRAPVVKMRNLVVVGSLNLAMSRCCVIWPVLLSPNIYVHTYYF